VRIASPYESDASRPNRVEQFCQSRSSLGQLIPFQLVLGPDVSLGIVKLDGPFMGADGRSWPAWSPTLVEGCISAAVAPLMSMVASAAAAAMARQVAVFMFRLHFPQHGGPAPGVAGFGSVSAATFTGTTSYHQ